MNTRQKVATLAALLAFGLGVSAAFADVPRPECDESDPASLCQGNIAVLVFVDRVEQGGGGFFNRGSDSPLPGARITLVMPDGRWVQQITGDTGLLSFPSVEFLPGDEASIEVEYPGWYRDAALVPCLNSPPRRQITRESFGALGSLQVVFCTRQYLPQPTD